ncbi:MAG: helix-turn-helix domain-containing protein [Gemmataceae bacterium]
MKNGWFRIPNRIITEGHGKAIGYSGLAVYLCLAHHADKSGLSWPSYATIAKEVGGDRSVVIAAVQRLREAGLIDVQERPHKTNLYRILDLGNTPPGGGSDLPPAGGDSPPGGGRDFQPGGRDFQPGGSGFPTTGGRKSLPEPDAIEPDSFEPDSRKQQHEPEEPAAADFNLEKAVEEECRVSDSIKNPEGFKQAVRRNPRGYGFVQSPDGTWQHPSKANRTSYSRVRNDESVADAKIAARTIRIGEQFSRVRNDESAADAKIAARTIRSGGDCSPPESRGA